VSTAADVAGLLVAAALVLHLLAAPLVPERF
jgi:hypothetical protein